MATTTAERVRKHRATKRAEAFSELYANGKWAITPAEFIEAKEAEACDLDNLQAATFSAEITLSFIDRLKAEYDAEDDGTYSMMELAEAWAWAEKQI